MYILTRKNVDVKSRVEKNPDRRHTSFSKRQMNEFDIYVLIQEFKAELCFVYIYGDSTKLTNINTNSSYFDFVFFYDKPKITVELQT
jgi:hypothetical protein